VPGNDDPEDSVADTDAVLWFVLVETGIWELIVAEAEAEAEDVETTLLSEEFVADSVVADELRKLVVLDTDDSISVEEDIELEALTIPLELLDENELDPREEPVGRLLPDDRLESTLPLVAPSEDASEVNPEMLDVTDALEETAVLEDVDATSEVAGDPMLADEAMGLLEDAMLETGPEIDSEAAELSTEEGAGTVGYPLEVLISGATGLGAPLLEVAEPDTSGEELVNDDDSEGG